MNGKMPNYIYIGPGKTGSTWLFEFFKYHPEIYVTPAKDLYFFDQFFDRGMNWYAKQFSGATSEKVVAEICHDYIVSPEAPPRLASSLPGVKLMMILREPIDRTFSAYLYRMKHGICETRFEEALNERPEIFGSSLYSQYIRVYLEHFAPEDILLFAFDDLKNDPQGFADQVCDRLQIDRIEIPESMKEPTLKAASARSLFVSKMVKRTALVARRIGLANLVGRLKTTRSVQRLLYRDFSEKTKPVPDPEVVAKLQQRARASVQELDAMMGTDFCRRWGY